ncbi:putative membrane protein [Haloactinopolyspora alba]|uniref:Putative membrane protein n=1 Tax=Haloactinopolyspora alba TaxID=648780 RepID=A0A2P8EBQ9_9ACTN|nr:anthrone oxygenase family protein [Haloactinopolyspora alba]PSL06880.1 putative membrane protein [Haloactinopolyspora alba]
MSDDVIFVVAVVAAVSSGVIAGLLFAFSSFVMRGLRALPPSQGLVAMQSINAAVNNPIFMLAFLGTTAANLVAVVVAFASWGEAEAIYLLVAGLVYLAGVLGVTAGYHVPRNTALAEVDPDGDDAEARWTRFAAEWTTWNHVRTFAGIAAAVVFSVSLSAG